MLLVKTKLASSTIAGVGIFAEEVILKGAYIWKFKEGFDLRVEPTYPETLPEPAKGYFMSHAYQNSVTKKYILCADDAKFMNHSDAPNVDCVQEEGSEELTSIAARDIALGEELTIDYREFDTQLFKSIKK